jgi:hypothetical protein
LPEPHGDKRERAKNQFLWQQGSVCANVRNSTPFESVLAHSASRYGSPKMWEAITYVSSGITLVAFISALIAWSFKWKSEEHERLIRTAKESDRAALVRNALEFLNVDPAGLSQEYQFKLAVEQIQLRGQRFKISSAVICFMALIAASITAYAIAQHGSKPEPLPPNDHKAAVDSALIGSWESVGKFQGFEVQLRFDFNPDGIFSRQYFVEDGGAIETTQDKFNMKGSYNLATMLGTYPNYPKYAIDGADSLRLSVPGKTIEFQRVGTSNYPPDALVGVWKTSYLYGGANWDWTVEIGRERNYHFRMEARDEGQFTAADGQWEMISKWDTRPIVGTYRVFAHGNPQFAIWPFGTIMLQRSR